MSTIKRKCFSFIVILAMMFSLQTAALMADDNDITGIITDTAEFLQRAVPSPGMGQSGGDWSVFALERAGTMLPDSFSLDYYNNIVNQLGAVGGVLSTVKYSEYSRVALAVLAVGADPRDIGGYDLLAPLLDFDMTVYQGLNGPIYAVIALTAAGYGDEPIVEKYTDHILAKQFEDGGFALFGEISDPDTTAMALTALSSYADIAAGSRPDMTGAITRGVKRLSELQRTTGGFTSFSSTNSESVSQAIIALCCLGIQLGDTRFVKEGNSLLDCLLTYYNERSGFEHEHGGGTSLMATEQALCALVALQRFKTGRNALFDMSDAPEFTAGASVAGLPGKHPDININDIRDVAAVFGWIGRKDHDTVTRAEFTAALIHTLGLTNSDDVQAFRDVPAKNIYVNDIYVAYTYGIIEGRSAGIFDPDSLMTRQEAAVIVSRAAALCGLGAGIKFDDTFIRDMLAQFTDYRSAAQWAAEGMAFCCYFHIMDDGNAELKPVELIHVEEAVEMVLRMLSVSQLIR